MSKKLASIEVQAEFEVKNDINTEEVDGIEIVTSVYTESSGLFCEWAEAWSLNEVVFNYVTDLNEQKRLDEEWKEWIANELEVLAAAVRLIEVKQNA